MEKRSSTNESRERFLMRLSLSRNHWLEQALFIEVNFISSIYIKMNDIFYRKKSCPLVDIIYFPRLSVQSSNFSHLSLDNKPQSLPSDKAGFKLVMPATILQHVILQDFPLNTSMITTACHYDKCLTLSQSR